jgi:hypothetical protein
MPHPGRTRQDASLGSVTAQQRYGTAEWQVQHRYYDVTAQWKQHRSSGLSKFSKTDASDPEKTST